MLSKSPHRTSGEIISMYYTTIEDNPPKHRRLNEDTGSNNGTAVTQHSETIPATDRGSLFNINILNDDALQNIFKKITIFDLCNVCEVCERFQYNAEQVFSVYHEKRFRFVPLNLIKPKVIVNFAHLLDSLYLKGSQSDLYLKFFKDNKIQSIRSIYLSNAEITVDKLKSLLANVELLHIFSCEFIGEKADILSYCLQLKDLKVKFSEFAQFSVRQIPTLDSFELSDHVYSDNLQPFILANPQLSTVCISVINKTIAPVDFEKHLLQFGTLKSLNILKLPCFQFIVTPFFNVLQTNNFNIEHIELENCCFNDASFLAISQITSIRYLVLTGVQAFSGVQLVDLAKRLPEIKMIRLETLHKSDAKITVDDIKNFVRYAKRLLLLTIGIISHMIIDQETYEDLLKLGEKRDLLTITFIHENYFKIVVSKSLRKRKKNIKLLSININAYQRYLILKEVERSDSDSSETYTITDDDSCFTSESSDSSSNLESADESGDSNEYWMGDVYKF